MVVLAALLAASPARSAAPEPATPAPAFRTLAVRVHGATFPYAVWTPPGYERSRAWPAILFLHGSGESGGDGLKPTRIGLGPQLVAHPERWPCVVIFPQKPTDTEEWEEREDVVLAVLADSRARFRLDEARIALTGMSQGGHGVWTIGARNAGRWTCLVPVCGYGRARTVVSRVDGLPVWAFHGLADDLVPPGDTQAIVAALRERRGESAETDTTAATVRVNLYPGVHHGVWDVAYARPDLPGWILSRPPRTPAR